MDDSQFIKLRQQPDIRSHAKGKNLIDQAVHSLAFSPSHKPAEWGYQKANPAKPTRRTLLDLNRKDPCNQFIHSHNMAFLRHEPQNQLFQLVWSYCLSVCSVEW